MLSARTISAAGFGGEEADRAITASFGFLADQNRHIGRRGCFMLATWSLEFWCCITAM